MHKLCCHPGVDDISTPFQHNQSEKHFGKAKTLCCTIKEIIIPFVKHSGAEGIQTRILRGQNTKQVRRILLMLYVYIYITFFRVDKMAYKYMAIWNDCNICKHEICVIIKSALRQNDVATSFWHNDDVINTDIPYHLGIIHFFRFLYGYPYQPGSWI